ASGSIGGIMNFQPRADQRARTIPRTYRGRPVIAEYPSRTISGAGIVRMKPGKRADLRRKNRTTGALLDTTQQRKQEIFTAARLLSNYMIRHNLHMISARIPLEQQPTIPWHEQLFTQRAEQHEQRKFPGQAIGQTLAIRGRGRAPTTPHGFIMHQLITRGFTRFNFAQAAVQKVQITLAQEITIGIPGFSGDPFPSMASKIELNFSQKLMATWAITAYFIAQFIMPPGWQNEFQQFQIRAAPAVTDDPVTGKPIAGCRE
ncbi:MAG: hypothetical protein OD918_00205, partial [Gammaproteobacteria bacterium]